MTKKPHVLDVGNHAKILHLLEQMAGQADLTWYDQKVHAVARYWILLASQHLRVARQLVANPRHWRAVVSRSYYAAYNCSRSVRYIVKGQIRLDGEDHQAVGDLPGDFPSVPAWSSFLTELRKDRNIADYDAWPGMRGSLSLEPNKSFARTEEFTKLSKVYLRSRGIKI
jgi:sulfur relay (sulfurtransferase) DsrC/TusE family protein